MCAKLKQVSRVQSVLVAAAYSCSFSHIQGVQNNSAVMALKISFHGQEELQFLPRVSMLSLNPCKTGVFPGPNFVLL